MKILLSLIVLAFSSCTAMLVSETYEFRFSAYSFTPAPTSLFPTFTPFALTNTFASPTREVYVSVTSPPIFLTSTPSPIPTIGMCGGVVINSLTKRSSPFIPIRGSNVVGSVKGDTVIQFTEYSQDGKWLHLIDGTWVKEKNDAFPFNLYVDVGAC